MASQVNFGPLAQVSMLCRSALTTEAWYRDVLRLPHIFTFGELVFFDWLARGCTFARCPRQSSGRAPRSISAWTT